MARASDPQKAERLNHARDLLQRGDPLSDAVEQLVRDCFISPRQAYRYLEQAQQLKGPLPPREAKLAFTVKLPHSLVRNFARRLGNARQVTERQRGLGVLNRKE